MPFVFDPGWLPPSVRPKRSLDVPPQNQGWLYLLLHDAFLAACDLLARVLPTQVEAPLGVGGGHRFAELSLQDLFQFQTIRQLAVRSQRRGPAIQELAIFLIAVVLRAFVVEAFKIPTGSMIPTLAVGDSAVPHL